MSKMVKNNYVIPTEQLEYYKKEIMELLPKYRYNQNYPDSHYQPTDKGTNALLTEYANNKGWMYPYFMKHSNYIGNGKIAFSADYHRKINEDGVKDFLNWLENCIHNWGIEHEMKINGLTYKEATASWNRLDRITDYMKALTFCTLGQSKVEVKVNGMTYNEVVKERLRLNDIVDMFGLKGEKLDSSYYAPYVSKEIKEKYGHYMLFISHIYSNIKMFATEQDAFIINELTKDLDLRAVKGQKISRIVGKFCRKLSIDKTEEYNQKFAKFGDDINELDIKRHTVISINPIDYLTMSFGNSWKSCHDIDKFNDRHCNGDGYHGCYSGGTLSYMLDSSSVVYYTIDHHYNGTDFEFQPKVNRCMFHLGEDKLVQGRVYPQSNDGDQTIYTEIRNIMQKVVSEMFNTDNLWKLVRGTNACESVINTYGTHYPDYRHFNTCNVSYLKPIEPNTKIKMIPVGHNGICPQCGKEHENQRCILCIPCEEHIEICPHCGREIDSFNHSININGEKYCNYCARWCDYHQRYEIDTEMRSVTTEFVLDHSGRRWYTYSKKSITVCNSALTEAFNKYKRDYETGRYVDTEEWTEGCITKIKLGDGNYKERYYSFKALAKRDGFKETHTGIWYSESEVKYNRKTNKYYHISEWNFEYNCPIEIVEEVKVQQEMLARRAERREARRARREAEAQNVA